MLMLDSKRRNNAGPYFSDDATFQLVRGFDHHVTSCKPEQQRFGHALASWLLTLKRVRPTLPNGFEVAQQKRGGPIWLWWDTLWSQD